MKTVSSSPGDIVINSLSCLTVCLFGTNMAIDSKLINCLAAIDFKLVDKLET